jgi:hypothetical protein
MSFEKKKQEEAGKFWQIITSAPEFLLPKPPLPGILEQWMR